MLHVVTLIVSEVSGVSAALRGNSDIELQCEDCQPDPEICPASLGVRYLSLSSSPTLETQE